MNQAKRSVAFLSLSRSEHHSLSGVLGAVITDDDGALHGVFLPCGLAFSLQGTTPHCHEESDPAVRAEGPDLPMSTEFPSRTPRLATMPSLTEPAAEVAAARAARIVEAVEGFIQGKRETVELALTCLLAEGHLLIEDVPGVGKTSLARSMATALGMTWHRIQFTPDLLPSDVTGVSVFHQGSQSFEFHPGPVFASIVLADEINRASPRTQSALLEVMEERTVTVDGVSHAVPRPFVVLATQNPIDAEGTFPLPEAQLDRFLMSLSIGYPDSSAEARVLANVQDGVKVDTLPRVGDPADVLALIDDARSVFVAPEVIDYLVALVASTRSMPGVRLGASPRGSVGLMRAAQASALLAGRAYVAPADAQRLAFPVLAHRLVLDDTDSLDVAATMAARTDIVRRAVDSVPAP